MINQGKQLPVMIYLAPFTSSGLARASWKAFAETLPQRHERLVNQRKMLPTILVMPDCFTSLGGNQFVDSSILGEWSSWLNKSLKPAISKHYSTSGKFALFGKSSGGFGALHNAIHHPKEWHAIAYIQEMLGLIFFIVLISRRLLRKLINKEIWMIFLLMSKHVPN